MAVQGHVSDPSFFVSSPSLLSLLTCSMALVVAARVVGSRAVLEKSDSGPIRALACSYLGRVRQRLSKLGSAPSPACPSAEPGSNNLEGL